MRVNIYRYGSGGRLDTLPVNNEPPGRLEVAMTHFIRRSPKLDAAAIAPLAVCFIGICAGHDAANAGVSTQPPAPGYSLSHTGGLHDFDYFVGGWSTKQRRLKVRHAGSTDWEEFPGTLCMTLYLGGMATVDELYMPTKSVAGLTLRTFDVNRQQWSIYWVNSKTGALDPVPVVGGFQGDHGEFYAQDEDDHRPVKVRFLWDKIDHDHARWSQAFSYDDRTWETNWVADFTRADTAKTCDNGRPRRP
jgi:hypothetical protein